MNARAKPGYEDQGPEMIANLMALVEASTTDSFAADIAKQLCLDDLCDNLTFQLASMGLENVPQA